MKKENDIKEPDALETKGASALGAVSCSVSSESTGQPVFKQEFMGAPVKTRHPQVGDFAHHKHTGEYLRIESLLVRSDSAKVCILEGGRRCVLPSARGGYAWELIPQNVELSHKDRSCE